MTITTEEFRVIHSWVGATEEDADIQTVYDDLENFDETILEILRRQLAEMIADRPAQMSVDAGTYSDNWGENIRAQKNQIAAFEAEGSGLEEGDDAIGSTLTQLVRTDAR